MCFLKVHNSLTRVSRDVKFLLALLRPTCISGRNTLVRWFLRAQDMLKNHLEVTLKHRLVDTTPRVSDSLGHKKWAQNLSVCLSFFKEIK